MGGRGQEAGLGKLLYKKRVGVLESVDEAEDSPIRGKGKEFRRGQFRYAERDQGSWERGTEGVKDGNLCTRGWGSLWSLAEI